jgi:hypothetical protein
MVAMEVEVVVIAGSGEKPEDDVTFVTAEEMAETVAETATETESMGVEEKMEAECPQAKLEEGGQEEDGEAESQEEELKVEKEAETPPREVV